MVTELGIVCRSTSNFHYKQIVYRRMNYIVQVIKGSESDLY